MAKARDKIALYRPTFKFLLILNKMIEPNSYHNAKNTSISHMFFKPNHGYHPQVSYKKDVNLCL